MNWPWPVAWLASFEDRDGVVVAVLRILGALSLLLFVFALLGILAIIDALSGPSSGWEGLIAAVALMVGGGSLVIGLLLSWVLHAGGAQYRVDPGAPLLVRSGVAMAVVGAVAAALLVATGLETPLDRYVAVLAAALAALGATLAWRVSRSRSPLA